MFIAHTTITKDGPEIPGETEQTKLLHVITDALEAASDEGKRIAGEEERGLISSAKNLAGRAVKIVSGIVSQIKDKVASLFQGGNDPSDVQDQLVEWAKDYAEVVSITEITDVIEETVLDTWQEQGVDQVYWATDENPCEECKENAEASPINIGEVWPNGGDTAPPLHCRCRCTLAKG